MPRLNCGCNSPGCMFCLCESVFNLRRRPLNADVYPDQPASHKINFQTGEVTRRPQFKETPLPKESTNALAGSEEKILVMMGRISRGESLFHPMDNTDYGGGELPLESGSTLLDDLKVSIDYRGEEERNTRKPRKRRGANSVRRRPA